MKNSVLIGLMALVWLVLMVNIVWNGTGGRWQITDTGRIAQLEVAKYTNQIMVVAVSKEGARLCLYERDEKDVEWKENLSKNNVNGVQTNENEDWKLVLETEAVIGKNGLGKTKEGDGKTPIGIFLFVKAFGILENPGTKMEYVQVNESHYWVDDSSSDYYNQFVSVGAVVKDWQSAEHICDYDESYNYVLATSYNLEQISGKGSAVFLHCLSEEARATAGCVAIPEGYMREIMKRVESKCVIIIDYVENIQSY